MTIHTWLAFAITILVAAISPGPNILIVMIHNLKYGWQASLLSILGNLMCLFIVALLAATGVGAVLKTNVALYHVLKVASATYLIYLGINIIRTSFAVLDNLGELNIEKSQAITVPPAYRLITQAFLVSASNPKSVLFLAAVFPQFLDRTKPILNQFILMFCTILVIVLIVHSTYGIFASLIRDTVMQPRYRKNVSRITGTVFICIGLTIILN